MGEYSKTPWGREIPYTSPTGTETTLFNIGVVAESIGRTSQTIRKWEVGGIIPTTPFKDKSGKRLYSKEHIDAIVRCAERCHLKQGTQISSTTFSDNLYKEFDKINKMFFSKGDKKDGKIKK